MCERSHRRRLMRSARTVGLLLLAVPLMTLLGSSFFPSYDDRPQHFAGHFHNIVDAGSDYLVALVIFLAVAGLVVLLMLALARSPLREETSVVWLVIGGLGISAAGFAVAGLTGLPVWVWAGQVADGSESMSTMAARSQGLAGLSQTVLLIFGFGGLLIAMSVLGVTAVVRGWAPKLALLATVAIAAGIVVVGVITSGREFWITIAALPLLWALTFGLILAVRGSFTPKSAHA
jgi:hypothetical protein